MQVVHVRVPVCRCCRPRPRSPRSRPQALVVAPSQELAMQIVRVAKGLLPPDLRYAVQQVIGGANPKRQAEALAAVPGPLVVVGTPGEILCSGV